MDIISAHNPTDKSSPSYPINKTTIASITTEGNRRRRQANVHYLHSMISESLADHFMVCTGPCVYMRMTLRLSGASSRTSQFLSLLTSIIGTTDTPHPPQPQYVDTAVTRRDEGDLYSDRLQFYIQEIRKTRQHDISTTLPPYCPSCSCHIDTLLHTLPQISKMDNLTEISRRLGAYSISHYDSFAPSSSSSSSAGKRRRRQQKHKQQYSGGDDTSTTC